MESTLVETRTSAVDVASRFANAQKQAAGQLEQLNNRLINYLGDLRFLKSENHRLKLELGAKRNTEQTETIQVYERTMKEFIHKITEYHEQLTGFDPETTRLQQELDSLRKQ